jgi:MtrB/PioB family decaheme-associated outer membrane protein
MGARQITVRIAALLAAGLAVTSAPAAEMPDWPCTRCPDTSGLEIDFDAGLAAVTDDAFRFGNITGLENDGPALLGDLYARYRDDRANYFLLDGYLRGENSLGLFARGGRQGLFELRARYQEIPRRRFGETATPYFVSDDQRLPAGWVAGSTTGQLATLGDSLRSEPIASDLDVLGLGLSFEPTSDWDLQFDYARRREQGRARWGSSFLFNAIELAAPVDQVTDNLDASIGYSRERWQLRVAYFGSTYENRQQRLRWENAYSVPFGVDVGQAQPAPDNEAHQVSLFGTLRLPARTVASMSLSSGEMTQDASLLAYTANPGLPVTPLPAGSADAQVQTTQVNLRVTSSPWRRLSFEGEWRYQDHDNRTPQRVFDYVITDTVPAPVSRRATAFDYRRDELKLRAEYRPWRALSMDLGLSTREVERSQQERDTTTTDKLWFELRTRVRGVAAFKAEALAEQRDGSEYLPLDDAAAPQNPLMRKYNLADRDRSGVRFRASLLAIPQADLAFEYALTDDDYDQSRVGLTGSRSRVVGVDAAYATGGFSAWASVSEENVRTEQNNSQTFGAPDWSATTQDRFTSAVLGFSHQQLFDLFDLELEYSYSRSRGRINNDTSGLQTSFPDLRQQRSTFRLSAKWPFRENLSLGIDYFFEELDSDDWALDGVGPDTVPTLLALGAQAWNYRSNVIYFSATFRQ